MKLSRRTDYALRAMTYLAMRRDDDPCSIAEIARAENIPKEFTAKVLKELCRTGFIRSRLGPRGGYRLARPAKEMTVLEIIEALDGPLAINDCLGDPGFCGQTPGCQMHVLFRKVNDTMKDILGSATVADIVKEAAPEHQIDSSVQPAATTDSLASGRSGLRSPASSGRELGQPIKHKAS